MVDPDSEIRWWDFLVANVGGTVGAGGKAFGYTSLGSKFCFMIMLPISRGRERDLKGIMTVGIIRT